MTDKLTLPPLIAGSSESKLSSFDSSTEEETSPDRGAFFSGVRRGIKKLGSLSGPHHHRPPNIQINERSAAGTAALATAPLEDSWRGRRHERSRSELSRQKPLPKTPLSPPVEELLAKTLSPPETPKALPEMSRQNAPGSRTSTMDSSTTSSSANQMYGSGYLPTSNTYTPDLNNSQSSFGQNGMASASRQEGEEEIRDIMTPRSNGPPSAGPSPAQPRPTEGATTGASGLVSQHLSSLMCSVHRTTGREPPPLVGASTNILGDKLYVYGGRVLSRTRPWITSDMYELDLIRRHWTKIEAQGNIPIPRYFHSMCALGDAKLVCYGGMSPAPARGQVQPVATTQPSDLQSEVVILADIHIYDAPSKTWSFIPTSDTPEGSYAHCATILPSSATFSSINAAASAIQHNLPGSNPNQGTLGVNLDGTGGAEMIVVGGQNNANHYIEQISVFNLRSLKWTSTQQLRKSCGAYRTVVVPLSSEQSARLGKGSPTRSDASVTPDSREVGSSMLMYSNYNFLDVKLDLQIRSSDGTLSEKAMQGEFIPPGLRFPNGGVIDNSFVVSGTYLSSSAQEYAIWALDLGTLTWSRIDAGSNIFSHGSWSRGLLWNRRNTFVVLGNQKRSLSEDYNHRRLNFTNVCMVDLEAFGLYDNPRKVTPMSGYVSASSPYTVPSMSLATKAGWTAGGRSFFKAAEELGIAALGLKEMADMDIICAGGERIPVNSRILSRRWGPYFVQLLREGAATQDGNDAATLRPDIVFRHNPSRNSSVTITPSLGGNSSSTYSSGGGHSSGFSTATTLTNPSLLSQSNRPSMDMQTLNQPPESSALPPTSRPRTLYLPHKQPTIQSLLHFLYTSSLPPPNTPLSTPQILCSLLQLARPYKVDGLLEAVVERLHNVLVYGNAMAVFNASAMAAGGGRGTSMGLGSEIEDEEIELLGMNGLSLSSFVAASTTTQTQQNQRLRINTSVGSRDGGEDDPMSASSSAASLSDFSESDAEGKGKGRASNGGHTNGHGNGNGNGVGAGEEDIWRGDISAVIGLQARGLLGLMEGMKMRERGGSVSVGQPGQGGTGGGMSAGQSRVAPMGLGIGNGGGGG